MGVYIILSWISSLFPYITRVLFQLFFMEKCHRLCACDGLDQKLFRIYLRTLRCGLDCASVLRVHCSFFYFYAFCFRRWTIIIVHVLGSTVNIVAVLFTYLKILKIGLMVLFTHLQIILLQCFQFSVSTKISYIQTDL